jgi:prevent-host-death family protein
VISRLITWLTVPKWGYKVCMSPDHTGRQAVSMGAKDLRARLAARVDAASRCGEATIVTQHGQPRAVLVSHAW